LEKGAKKKKRGKGVVRENRVQAQLRGGGLPTKLNSSPNITPRTEKAPPRGNWVCAGREVAIVPKGSIEEKRGEGALDKGEVGSPRSRVISTVL